MMQPTPSLRDKQVDIVPLRGGIDLQSTVLNIKPYHALELLNFEPELQGGYRRINGYERVDGQAAPSAAVYYTVVVADSSGISVNDTLTGVTSGATSKVVIKDDATNTLGITVLSGNYTLSETANATTITAVEVQSGQTDPDTDNIWQLAAEDYYRSLIGALPGSGDVLGAVQFGAKKYAFRSNGSAVLMYESSASGWSAVTLYSYIFFDGGVLSEGDIAAGTAITGAASGATATVKDFIKNAGSYGSDASGYMVIDVTSGTFQDDENIQVSAVTKCVADGIDTAISFAEGGQFEFIQHNFYGSSSTKYLYGCDGINFAWQFDGTVLTPIFFPAPDKDASYNTPKYIAAHRQHLFLSFPGGQMANSSIGEPLVFSALLGAAEFGMGDEITGMVSRVGEVLAIYTRGRVYGLYGYSAADWTLETLSDSSGAKDRTVQIMGTVFAVDDKGITPIDRVQAYGNFESSTISRLVKPILDQYSNSIVASTAIRERNQYRLYFDDGTALVMAYDQYKGDNQPAFTKLKYVDIPTCLSSSEDDSGDEVILFGDENGFVYQSDIGYTFDGDEIEFAYRTPFLNQKTPHIRKTYRKLFVDVQADTSFTMQVYHNLSFGEPFSAANNGDTLSLVGGGGFWDLANWDDFYWDAEIFSSRGVDLYGSGKNISLLFYGKSKYIRPFTIETIEIHFLSRRLKRTR